MSDASDAREISDLLDRTRSERDNYKSLWDQACEQTADMCTFLGVDPEERPADAWTLRDEIKRLKSERDRFAAVLEELSDGACHSKYGPGCDDACKRVAWRALNP